MKSTINKTDEEVEYPRLMIRKEKGDNLIVMMFSENKGCVVHDKGNMGERNSTEFYWDGWDIEDFKPFHGSVTLEN